MIETLEDFIRAYEKIRERGWIRTHQAGPPGVGRTLEDLLGIPENNLSEPDFGAYELKSCRINSPGMLTMFTKAPQPRGANERLRQTYGYPSGAYDNDEKVLHATLTAARFVPVGGAGQQLRIVCGEEKISIASRERVENIYWTRESLKKAFEKKYKGKFVYAKARCRGDWAWEEFYYDQAYEVSGFSYEAMVDLLERGMIFIDLRIGQFPNGRTHDHGTGFRIREADHSLLFRHIRRIV